MEYQDEDQEFLDYRSPKGQLIKLLEQKCKKPVIDNSLGEILDQFIKLNKDQEKYLENGIFQINFAEDALLLQGCATLYGKRVDKLWEELLQVHTGLVKCDQKIDKEDKNNSQKLEARQKELQKLEERLNRRKRKKIALVETEIAHASATESVLRLESMEKIDDLLSCEDSDINIGEDSKIPFELDEDVLTTWRNMELKKAATIESTMSPLVLQYHRQTYRMKNYLRPPDDDDIIYDVDDPEEFYTRRSRIPSYDVIMHLMEYNDRCLVPDNKNATIAKLRLAFVEKKKYMIKHNITFETPYEQYKEHYEKFCQEYFEKERKKIQNMPQNTKEEVQAFYRALEKKEQEAWTMKRKLKEMGIQSPNVNFDTVILDPLEREDGKTIWRVLLTENGIEDEEHDPDMQALHSQEDFAIDLDQVNKTAADKLRSDSGYFESGFATDDENDRDDFSVGNMTPCIDQVVPDENVVDKPTEPNTEELTQEEDKINPSQNSDADSVLLDTSLQSEEGENMPEGLTNEAHSTEHLDKDETSPQEGSNIETNPEKLVEEVNLEKEKLLEEETSKDGSVVEVNLEKEKSLEEETNNDASVVEAGNATCLSKIDHIRAQFEQFVKGHKYTEFADGCIMIEYNKERAKDSKKNGKLDKTLDEEVAVKHAKLKEKAKVKDLVQKQVEKPNNKRKLESASEVPIKRRKLSAKQIQKLKTSLIHSVHNLKWESFFSLNYQTESGEGDVIRVNYASSDVEDDHNDQADDHSDAESHVSDHGCATRPESCRPDSCRPESCRPDSAIDISDPHNATPIHMDSIAEEPELNTEFAEPNPVVPEPQPGCSHWPDSGADSRLLEEEMAAHAESMRQSEDLSNKTKYEIEREKVRKSVAEWRAHIMPKLRQLDEHDFDIHEYGSNIIEKFDNVDEQRPFKGMVDGKSSAEVVRYFISSLQLANTYNIEICGVQQGQLSNDTFELKLLNKERYHEHLEEYQAPSEEGIKEKLKKIKMIKQQETKKASKKSSKKLTFEAKPLRVVLNKTSISTDDQSASSSGYQSMIDTSSTSEQASPSSSSFSSSRSSKHERSSSSCAEREEAMPASKKIKIISCYSMQQQGQSVVDLNQNVPSTSSWEPALFEDSNVTSSDLLMDELTFFDELQSGCYSQSTPRRTYSKDSTN